MLAQIVLYDDFAPLDAIAPYDVLCAGGLEVELVSAEGAREVRSGVGPLTLRASAVLDPQRADLVVVPGVAGQGEEVPTRLRNVLGTGLPALLKEACDKPGLTVATVCGGSLVLAMAGLIDGRHATTHHDGTDLLDGTGAIRVNARLVDDGDLVTGAAVTSGLDLGLYLLERELGPRVALAVEQLFDYERRGTVWRAS